MAIKLKDLVNRAYVGRQCTAFDYVLNIPNDTEEFKYVIVRFTRAQTKETQWNMQVVIPRNRDSDSQVYNFGYIMPKNNLPLELICATGLKYFQLRLKSEIQYKSNLDFVIGDVTNGM